LRRSLGLFDVTLFFVVATTNLQWIATAAAGGPSSLVVWVIGGLALFVPLAIAVVFLSSRYPEAGGLYVWSKRAFGPAAGFMTGWTYWTGTVIYFPGLLYFTAGNALYLGGSAAAAHGSPAYYVVAALAGLTIATILNIVGIDVGKWLNNAGGICRWTAILLLIALGAVALWKFGSASSFSATALRPGTQLKDVLFWSTIALAWVGLESISFMSGEVKNPRRSIPRGLIFAAPLIVTIYLAGTTAVLVAVPARDVNPLLGAMQAIDRTAHAVGAPALSTFGAFLVTLSCLGSAGLWMQACARIPFVAGVDRYLPAAFGRLHPRWSTPVAALLTQFGVAAVLIVLGQSGTNVKGAYDVLVSATVVTALLPFLYIFATAIKLRSEAPAPGEVRIIGGSATVYVASGVGFLTTAAAIVLAVFPADDEPNKTLAVVKLFVLTALMLLGGAAVYLRGKRSAAKVGLSPIPPVA
jgi:amino acid transporter